MLNEWIDVSKLTKYLIAMVVGFALIFYGVGLLLIDAFNMNRMTDDEVIKRAKELGMVELRQLYNDQKK